ncbi:hypothetical protein F4780DRAFT_678918 [Xylariomycetidae sp. FL0641]|nr:hypothetical protein F4780DRAFT_678918 [Xylariomycetidae sp. FL0641]
MANHRTKLVEEGRDNEIASSPQQTQCLLQRLWHSPTLSRRAPPPSPTSYPPISSIPRTTPERLAQAASEDDTASSTVMYLAYGSNLAASTFLGARGIRPLSQVNVSAPAFDLTFDLPGFPYTEPCFANTAPRKLPPPPASLPAAAADDDPDEEGPGGKKKKKDDTTTTTTALLLPALPGGPPTWTKGLYGVVYEVTRDDYATIVRTEGGGASYRDVLTPCFALPAAIGVPEKPSRPAPVPVPVPFLAHTLYAPRLPDGVPDDDDGSWWKQLFLPPRRPDPGYAQASARYLGLLRAGAAEHGLPADYRRYLEALPAYTVTARRQRVGRFLYAAVAFPVFGLLVAGARALADDAGNVPRWLALLMALAFNLAWLAYDWVVEPLCGDGERTMEDDEDDDDGGDAAAAVAGEWKGAGRPSRWKFGPGNAHHGSEKNALLSDW